MIKQLSTKHLEEAAAASSKPNSGAVGPNRSQSLRRGQPNTFTVKPSPMKSDNGRRIKMSFKDGQILQQPRIQITRPEQPAGLDSPAMNTRLGQHRNKSAMESLTNLRSDISSLIEQSFGTGGGTLPKSPSSPANLGLAAGVSNSPYLLPPPPVVAGQQPALETSFAENGVTATMPSKVLTGAAMRRQSSAFEFGTNSAASAARRAKQQRDLGVLPSAGTIGRQSSAFELAAVNRGRAHTTGHQHNRPDPEMVMHYMSSSVKDLVKELEGVDFNQHPQTSRGNHQSSAQQATTSVDMGERKDQDSKMQPPPPASRLEEEQPSLNADDEGGGGFKDAFDCFDDPAGANEWTDAKDFFSGATPTESGMFANVMQTESAGCKRSSIIKIREKGIVSRNVETFKPRTTAGAARFAASVGAAAAAGAASATASAGSSNGQTLMGPPAAAVPTPQRRRQTTHVRTGHHAGPHTAMPPTSSTSSSRTAPGTPGRRLSARMGVAGTRRTSTQMGGVAPPPSTSSGAGGAGAVRTGGVTGGGAGVQRRQTLTGIRTTATVPPASVVNETTRKRARAPSPLAVSKPPLPAANPPKTATVVSSMTPRRTPSVKIVEPAGTITPHQKATTTSVKRTPSQPGGKAALQPKTPLSSVRKARRIEERRHLTVAGFEGEMRSPLKEKQNLTASVQRSKSAQTPSRQKHMENRLNGGGRVGSPYGARGSPRINQENRRSKTPQSSSKKQRRQLIERVPTPKELPLVSLSLTSPAPTDIGRSPRVTKGGY